MLFSLVALFCLRAVFNQVGQIGHNWDFTFPAYVSNPLNINYLSQFTWNSNNYGYQQHLTGAHLIPNLIYSFLVALFGVIFGSKILLFAIVLISLINFRLLSQHFFKNLTFLEHFALSLLYGISPFAFNEIVGGSWYMWLSYSFIPLYIYSVSKFFSGQSRVSLLGLIFSSVFVISSMQNFVLVHGFLIIYHFLSHHSSDHFWKKMFVWHILLIISNFYWLWLTAINISHLSREFTSGQFTSQFDQVRYSSQPLQKIFDLTGYLNRHFYFHALPQKLTSLFVVLNYLVWSAGGLIYLKFFVNKKNKPFVVLVILFFFLVKGGLQPFSPLVMFIFEKVPLMSLYRSPQHLMIVPQLVFVFLSGIVLSFLSAKISTGLRTALAFFLVIIYTSGWWYHGDLGHLKMKQNGRDYVDFYHLDPGLNLALNVAEANNTGLRHLFLPVVQSPLYHHTIYQGSAQGGVSEYMYMSTPTFSAENTLPGKQIEEAICNGDLVAFEKLVMDTSIGFVTLRNDISPAFTNCTKTWQWRKVSDLLNKSSFLKPLFSTDHIITYLVTAPSPIIDISGSDSHLRVQKINPTKYVFNLVSTSSANTIVHNESYSPYWHVQDSKGKIFAQSTNIDGKNVYISDTFFREGEQYTVIFSLQQKYNFLIALSYASAVIVIFVYIKKK